MAILETQNLTYKYSVGTPFEKVAIEDISISVEKGDFIGIIGHTGSGKSTLVQHLNGLLKPTSGTILLDGKDIHSDKNFTRQARFKVGLCFQYPEYQLFENTVYEDIAFGPKNMKLSKEEIKERVLRAAEFVGVRNDMLQKSPFDLSGGEKRRVAIAGVMAMQPEILILDEPSAGLDPKGRKVISEMIEQYRKNTGSTVIVVSHSMEDVAESADKVLVMNRGKVEYFASVDEVFSNAEHLVEIGLNVPEITKVFLALKKQGYDVRTDIYSVNEAKAELLRLFKERGVLA
ncbi:MAG: energy-coupling factor transporter ATPase [Ruminococcus sp.]|nr:energy-coupling factor transporter ATPase [Ruminococcus sp.]MDY6058813.1 energy-coupling factor transporter ATPase [Candidatus Fimenecus sp.]